MQAQSALAHVIARPTFRSGAIATIVVALFAASVWYVSADYGTVPAFGFAVMFLAFFAPMPFIHGALELWTARRKLRDLVLFFQSDQNSCFVSDRLGRIWYSNKSGLMQTKQGLGGFVFDWFDILAPGAEASIQDLIARLDMSPFAEAIVLQDSGYIRISAWRHDRGRIFWRVDPTGYDAIGTGTLPKLCIMRVTEAGDVLEMNQSALDLFGTQITHLHDICGAKPIAYGVNNTLETRQGAKTFVVMSRPLDMVRELYFLPPDTECDATGPAGDFDALPVPMIKLTAQGVIFRANRPACELLSIDPSQEVLLQNLFEGLGRSIPDWLADAIEGRGINHPEFLRLARKDREVFVQVVLNKITLDGEVGLIAVLSDATELKTLEAQFVQSQKMQAIGQLAGGVAHDFNNLLTAISGRCDLMLLRHDGQSQDYADLVQINQNANRAAALVSQLLAFSRKQTLRPEALDMRDTLADLTHLLNRLVGEKVELDLKHDPNLKTVRADKRQLEQVFMNLVVNARDAMPDGGVIQISTQNLTLDTPLRHDRVTIPVGEYVSIRVADQGCGISADKLAKIFEPFYTTKRTGEGTGLGLSTAYGIIKQTGGYIFVESQVGQGTEFRLIFPAFDVPKAQLTPSKAANPPKNVKFSGGVILLVEDEAPVRTFAARALKLRGFDVIEASCAEEALERLTDPDLHIDVFVTDIVMPGRDGPSWVKEALVNRPETRVVFVSGYAEDVLETQQASVPNSVFLPKPFSLERLTETVQKQMQS